MSESGVLEELLRSRIAQCHALEQEVETWKRRYAQAVEMGANMAHRVEALEGSIAKHRAYLNSMADGENDYTSAAHHLEETLAHGSPVPQTAYARAWDLGYVAHALGINDAAGDPNPYREVEA